MRRLRRIVRALAAAGALVVGACAERLPTSPDALPEQRSGSVQRTPDPDAQSSDPNVLGRAVPGFGGLFFDSSGAPTVYLTDPGRRPEIERVLGRFLKSEGLVAADLRVLKGDFDLVQLDQWFERVAPAALGVAGAVFADLDEASNRLRIGVENAIALTAVQNRIAVLGILPLAAIVEETQPIQLAATLRDDVRPVIGGLEINYTGGWRCTVGFNATRNGVSSFVTASHCSITYGSLDGTVYTQPGGSLLGREVSDPAFFMGGVCPLGRRCRYSDAARAAYAAGVPFTLGRIAKPTGLDDGSVEIAGAFSISKESGGLVGKTANKVGRTTGWSQGRITKTCVTTNVLATNVTLLCQHWVDGGVAGGDSGSPVFLSSSGNGGVSLAGILWGGNSAGTTFIYSPISNIERELGSLTSS